MSTNTLAIIDMLLINMTDAKYKAEKLDIYDFLIKINFLNPKNYLFWV